MKFRVSRTSDWAGDNEPCKGSFVEENTNYGTKWAIELADLDALIDLCKKEGYIIVKGECPATDGLPSLEIYDDYRE